MTLFPPFPLSPSRQSCPPPQRIPGWSPILPTGYYLHPRVCPVPSDFTSVFVWRSVQRFKLDGGETSGAEGPAFVLRHRTSNLTAQHTAECTPADPMSPREEGDSPTSGSSTSHLSTAECPSHSGVSMSLTHTHSHVVGSW